MNFSADLLGDPDTRPSTWGRAGFVVLPVSFKPPAGCRVRILRVYGDFLIWPKGKVPEGTYAGALFGLQTTSPDGSERVQYAADNTMLYIQNATNGSVARAPFDYKIENGLLQKDNVLLVKLAVWLNDTGLPIHMEPTFVVIYRFEEGK